MSKTVYQTLDIDVEQFLTTIFPPDELARDEIPLLGYPHSFVADTGETVNYVKQMVATPNHIRQVVEQDRGWLYCVSTITRPARGAKVQRRYEDVHHAWVIVLDDIGTKSAVPPVAPSFIVETSKGNFQYGYLLEPVPVHRPERAAYFDACLVGLAAAGFNDPGCRTATRVMKLPGAVHKSGFPTRVVRWEPGLVWELEQLMQEMDVAPARLRVRPVRRGVDTGVGLDDVEDTIMDYLAERGLITGLRNSQWCHIHCPWEDEHTSGDPEQPGSSTSYSPLDYGMYGRQFRCMHGHCVDRGAADLLEWARLEGGVVANDKRHGSMVPALFKNKTGVE